MIDLLAHHDQKHPAIITETSTLDAISYGELVDQVSFYADYLRSIDERTLVFLVCDNSALSIMLYLACRKAQYPVALVEPNQDALLRLINIYRPPILLMPNTMVEQMGSQLPSRYGPTAPLTQFDYTAYTLEKREALKLHPDLTVLLATSGSTGNPKFVKLTAQNLDSNAASIAQYLGLSTDERSIQGLPMHYSYGLSLINSHLYVGGTVVLTNHSFMRPEFWSQFDCAGCTSFAGVPYMYETLQRLRFDPKEHPSLQTMTQAGGALRPELIEHFNTLLCESERRFYVMYGQTEAAPRIAYVPPSRLADKIGSIGVAVPGGTLDLAPIEGAEDATELIYKGPNVMMGYAHQPDDLILPDMMHGRLATGDIATTDDDGFYFLQGRLKRFVKLFGKRINLVDVESYAEQKFPLSAVALERNSLLHIYAAIHTEAKDEAHITETEISRSVSRYLGVTPKVVFAELIDTIPMMASGKKDYKALS